MNQTKRKRLPIGKLKPAAARLMLASFEMEPGDTYAELIERSGICDTQTFLAARDQLKELGFIFLYAGQEYTTLFAQDPEATRVTEPVATMWPGTITKTTKAVQ